MSLSVVAALLFGLSLLLIWALNGELVTYPPETTTRPLKNGGTLLTVNTVSEYTGWGGDSFSDAKYYYLPPNSKSMEEIGTGSYPWKMREYSYEDRIMFTESATVFLRDLQGNWKEVDWRNELGSTVREKLTNGYASISSVSENLNQIEIVYRSSHGQFRLNYSVRPDQDELKFLKIKKDKPRNSLAR